MAGELGSPNNLFLNAVGGVFMSDSTASGERKGAVASGRSRAQSAEFLFNQQPLGTGEDVAAFFNVPYANLSAVLYAKPEHSGYRSFEIPKRTGGVRRIDAPTGILKELQDKLAVKLNSAYSVHPSAHGFIESRSIVTNAAYHTGQCWVLNIDLADFFPSINFGRIRGLFQAAPFNAAPPAATLLAQICIFRNGLPQGAPTSPVLSNLVSATLDRRLTRFAKQHGLRYSRYADDITLSSGAARFPKEAAISRDAGEGIKEVVVGAELEQVITQSGFAINSRKVRLQHRSQRQSVTGLKVNVRINVGRERIRNLRAMIHAWRKFGLEAAGRVHFHKHGGKGNSTHKRKPHVIFKEIVYGHLAFIRMVRGPGDPTYLNLCSALIEVDRSPPKFLKEMARRDTRYDVFLSHASEDKVAIAQPIYEACQRLGMVTFLDREQIAWGDNFADRINTALGQARIVLVIVSKNSVTKKWPLKEINAALNLEIAGEAIVLPLIVGTPDLRRLPLIRAKDQLKWDGDAAAVAEQLAEALESAEETEQKIPEPQASPRAVSESKLQGIVDFVASVVRPTRLPGTFAIELPDVPGWPKPEMVVLPQRTFLMGSPRVEGAKSGPRTREQPEHEIRFSHRFAIGKKTVTMAEWEAALADEAATSLETLEEISDCGWGRGEQPIINVSWVHAQVFIKWLNRKLSLLNKPDAYRLPTEAEWEYCCRAGSRGAYSFGDQISSRQANFDGVVDGRGGEYRRRPITVGSFAPNAYGLYDMHGNVWEWCADAYSPNYIGAPCDGSARVHPPSALKVLRGGSWSNKPEKLRSSNRFGFEENKTAGNVGFRLARTIQG